MPWNARFAGKLNLARRADLVRFFSVARLPFSAPVGSGAWLLHTGEAHELDIPRLSSVSIALLFSISISLDGARG
jgi:hypothetical protein